MIPSMYFVLGEMSLTANGKIDRQKLILSYEETDYHEVSFTSQNPFLDVVTEIWADILGLDLIGFRDNFFELGGHSLLVVQLISRLRDVFRIELPIRAVFDAPTPVELAQRVEEARLRLEPNSEMQSIQPVSRLTKVMASFTQQQLWSLNQMMPQLPIFNTAYKIQFVGSINEKALEQSFLEIIRRHELLRTTFEMVNGQLVQVISPSHKVKLQFTDLTRCQNNVREKQANHIIHNESIYPFDLTHGPLLRLHLIRLEDANHILIISVHHIVWDGWSMTILWRELKVLYQRFCNEQTSFRLPELPIQFADYVHWQMDWLESREAKAQANYWKNKLTGKTTYLDLPFDHLKTSEASFWLSKYSITFPKDVLNKVKNLSRRKEATPFMVMLSILKVLLHFYTTEEEISIATLVANRNRTEFESLIGLFTNTLILCTDLSGDPTFPELLLRVRETTLDAHTNADIPFEKIIQDLEKDSKVKRSSFAQVMFILQNTPQEDLSLPNLKIQPYDSEQVLSDPNLAVTTFDLTLILSEKSEGLTLSMHYKSELFERSTIQKILEDFQQLTEFIIKDPESTVFELCKQLDIYRSD